MVHFGLVLLQLVLRTKSTNALYVLRCLTTTYFEIFSQIVKYLLYIHEVGKSLLACAALPKGFYYQSKRVKKEIYRIFSSLLSCPCPSNKQTLIKSLFYTVLHVLFTRQPGVSTSSTLLMHHYEPLGTFNGKLSVLSHFQISTMHKISCTHFEHNFSKKHAFSTLIKSISSYEF